GEGSKFYFTLEQTVVDDTRIDTFDVTGLAPADHKKRSTTTFTAPDARMLIVDDTPMNLKVLTGLLKRTGITIDTAASGEECIRVFGENSYDIIFLDYRMPRLDGIETMLKLRDTYPQKTAHTPIISLTASAIAGDREKMLAAGFDDYLTKPVVISEMERVILQYLPPEKIRKDTDTKQDRPEVLSDELPSALYSIPALDCESGLTYCGDAEVYLDALRDYTDSLDDRIEKITAALLQDDRENYTIYVHSLKSMSRAVGAETIAEAAARLEAAGNDGDTDTMQRDTEKVLKMCLEMKEHLDEALG
ncbi:MAG: response regulator, partial [Lachnospiraceae bacterium]|nr:response regulator [Lachnospiraceae bacterium]